MKKTQILIFTIICLFQIYETRIQNCGTPTAIGMFSKVTVTSCSEEAAKCILQRGSNVSIDISFTLNKSVEKVEAVVHGTLHGVPFPVRFPLNNPDGCVNSGLICPLSGGKDYNYEATLFVRTIYPKTGVNVKWELKNENNEEIVCVIIPAEIK